MGSMMKTVMGIITIVLAFILFPIILTATGTLLAENLTNFTGFSSIGGILPTILFVGMIFGGGLLTFQGVSGGRKGKR